MASLEHSAAELLRQSAEYYHELQRMHAEQINSMIEKIMLEFLGGGGGGGPHRGDLHARQFREITCFQGEENQWKEWSLKFTSEVKEANPEIYDGRKWAESEMQEVTLDAVKNRFGGSRARALDHDLQPLDHASQRRSTHWWLKKKSTFTRHDGPDAVPRSLAEGTGAPAAAHGRDPADAASGAAGAITARCTLCVGNAKQSQQLILKGFDNIETFSGGEEQWQNWSWKVRTAVSGMSGELLEMLITAETSGTESKDEVLKEDRFVDANRERCMKTRREMCSVLARYTNSEASTIVKSVTELDGVGAWAKLHANYSRRTLGRMFRVQRECMYPKPTKDVGQVRFAIMQWEEKWKAMMSELGGDAKIPDLWRMSALLEICPKDVKEQMLLRLDEVAENYENLKVKVISYTSNKAEQSRGQKETAVPMELDYVSGSDMYDEDLGDVDEVRRDRSCYNCGTFLEGLQDEKQGQRECKIRRQGTRQIQDCKKEQEGKVWASPDVSREDARENRTIGDTKDSVGRAARQDTSRQSVDGESTTWMKTMWTVTAAAAAGEAGSNPSRRGTVMWVEYGSAGTWRSLEDEETMSEGSEYCEREESTGRPGCRSKY